MTNIAAYIAANRFGFCARGNDLAVISGDPRGWLENQLSNAKIPASVAQDLGGPKALASRMQMDSKDMPATEKRDAKKQEMAAIRKIHIQETGARIAAQAATDQPFIERLVLFWSNHFAVSIQKPFLAAIVNRYEVDAIRPHVTGYFRDMVLATARHPAMLLYLDNARSIGPGSQAGQRRTKGLNENYARELMELHTLGVGGGYTQADVIALAKILTGWSVDMDTPAGPAFIFRAKAHEPGAKTLLGKTIIESGKQEGIEAITQLCAHPATARHIATKLARHFLSDTPPASAIDKIAASFTQSDGHLPTVMKTLIALDEARSETLAKFKNPYEYLVSAYRLTGATPKPAQAINHLATLNFRPFNPAAPTGEPDTVADWAGPDALVKRIDWAHAFSQTMPTNMDPMLLATRSIGDALKEKTINTIKQAASGRDGIAFLLLSPEFQRR